MIGISPKGSDDSSANIDMQLLWAYQWASTLESKLGIEPHLGALTKVGGKIPHPNGEIFVKYELLGEHWKIAIEIPDNVSVTFVWKGKKY